MATFGTFVDGVTLKASELNDFFKLTSFTPVVKQNVTLSNSAVYCRYFQVNKTVYVIFSWGAGIATDGTLNNRIEINLPITAASRNIGVIGSGFFYDNAGAGTGDIVRFSVVQYSTTTASFLADTATSPTNYLGLSGTAITQITANADGIHCCFWYEAA